MADLRELRERGGFKIFMEWDGENPKNKAHMRKRRGVLNSWWLSWLAGKDRSYEVTQKFWIEGPNRGDTLKFILEPGYHFDGPTFYDDFDWRTSLWWPFGAAHDIEYKERRQYCRVRKNGEIVDLGNRERVDEFFRDGLLAWGEPAWLVNFAYGVIRQGGHLVMGEH